VAHLFSGSDWTDLYVRILRAVYETPDFRCSPRGIGVRELVNVMVEYTSPRDGGVIDFSRTGMPERQEKYDSYRLREHDWYMSGSLRAEDIGAFWRSIADGDGNIVSNYGFICLHDRKYVVDGGSMTGVEYVVDVLRRDPDSRRAVIHYNEVRHHNDGTGNPKDHPCTMHDQFLLRDGRLYLTVVMRSNDTIKGISYDMPWACALLCMVADMLSVEPHSVTFCDASFHVYDKDEKMVRRILSLPEICEGG
jgi:thymidylate synthase